MKKRIKFISVALALLFLLSSVMLGCSTNPATTTEDTSATTDATTTEPESTSTETESAVTEPVTLSVYSDASDDSIKGALTQIVADFEAAYPNIKIDLNFPGTDYENIMKVKMASNSLPDVFDTHGWAIARYGEYLADLRDCPWATELTDSAKSVVTDADGKVYCLPMITAMDGILYNADMFEEYGIAVPQTMDELTAAAETIKEATNGACEPFFMSAVDSVTIAQFLDIMSTPLLISPDTNYASQLKDGTFDWSNWSKLPETLLEWQSKGLINSDVLTAKASDLVERFATGKICFSAYFLSLADAVTSVNPDMHVGIMPVPAFDESDTPSFSGGERYTMGIWKDTTHMDEAKIFVNFVAQPEELALLVTASKEPAGIKNVTVDNDYQVYFDQYASTRVFPYFDREYLENGMWDVMSKNGAELIAGQITASDFCEIMKSENDRLAGN